jgi:hypothetical protein
VSDHPVDDLIDEDPFFHSHLLGERQWRGEEALNGVRLSGGDVNFHGSR